MSGTPAWRGRRRWPPPGGAEPKHPGRADPQAELYKALGDMAVALRWLAPSVLDTSTVLLDANGQATKAFRVPFAAVAVLSASTNTLTVTAAAPAAAAPGPGPASGQVPPLGFAAHNITAYAWTIYGGNPGDLVTVSTFGRPVPPVAESGLVAVSGIVNASGGAAFGQPSIATAHTATGPAAGATVAALAALPPGLFRLDWSVGLSGTTAAADANNMQLVFAGNPVIPIAFYASTAAFNNVPQLSAWIRSTTGVQVAKVVAIALGTATAIYQAQLVATQVGP